jgi:predicted nuclease of restriction endonuclease-like (RecB) superfamily
LLVRIPWGHHVLIINKCKGDVAKALFYVRKTVENGWSRNVLAIEIDGDLYSRQGKAVTNFALTMPAPDSDLAQQLTKDPYIFEVQGLAEKYRETELTDAMCNNIVKLLKSTKQYDLVEVKADDSFAGYFLEHYKNDIAVYFPEFTNDPELYDVANIICCNADPAGILLGKKNGEEIEISLDYTTPMYRDCSAGRFLYAELEKKGIKKLVYKSADKKHAEYLEKMGFSKNEEGFIKEI